MSTIEIAIQKSERTHAPRQAGFSLLEMVIVCAILTVVLASIFGGVNTVIQRSQAEQVKVDMVQEGREFIDEFDRDLHQAGYPNCHMIQAIVGATKYTVPRTVQIQTRQIADQWRLASCTSRTPR